MFFVVVADLFEVHTFDRLIVNFLRNWCFKIQFEVETCHCILKSVVYEVQLLFNTRKSFFLKLIASIQVSKHEIIGIICTYYIYSLELD